MALAVIAIQSGPAAASQMIVRYHGYRIAVPAGWPVFRLTAGSHVCVRFNRHAVYLGTPPPVEDCPAAAIGRTEAILVQPLAASAATGAMSRGPALGGGPGALGRFSVPAEGLSVTVTWRARPGLIRHALGVRALPGTAGPARLSATAASTKTTRASTKITATAHTAASTYTGPGFDACSTPSSQTMSAWGASPYRAIGIYIGGENRACSQANLTATWTAAETAAGWHFIPIYVGLQAPGACGCAAISASSAASQGTADASAAISEAQALGIGPGSPIYDDMEGYSRSSGNTASVLAFLSAWTSQLHAAGYLSGVYSSADSGIVDLANRSGTGYAEPDDLWFARWNNVQTTSDSSLPPGDWANHQRLHQYSGDHYETYGGVRMDIDGDYLDAATAGASSTALFPDGTFVQVSGTQGVYRIAGGAPMWVNDPSMLTGQTVDTISLEQFQALPIVPKDGTFITTTTGVAYRIVGGAPLFVSDWSVFGGPQPTVTVDEWDLDNITNELAHLNAVPANGSLITTPSGQIYRIAGGAPFRISRWAVFHRQLPSVTVDPWDIANISNPASHLLARPVDGTVVEALPSHWYWTFSGGWRQLASSAPQAIPVDDSGIVSYPGQGPLPVPMCKVPGLRRMPFFTAKAAIKNALCSLGKVGRPHHWGAHHRLRVYWQIPGSRHSYPEGHRVGIKMK